MYLLSLSKWTNLCINCCISKPRQSKRWKMWQQNPSITFDEISMEKSKSFVKALQDLKNLRPQLYTAAEYCEKSYLHNEQKLMVLDNVKDYAVRALVNAVDHLGTVSYKLADLFEQQTLDVSTVELKISCLGQKLLTWKTYMDKEGLRQQQLVTIPARHHKHYILPNFLNREVQLNMQKQTDTQQKLTQAKLRPHPSGNPASKTLSWHLAAETESDLNGDLHALNGIDDPKACGKTSEVFQLLDAEMTISSKPSSTYFQSASRGSASSAALYTSGVTRRDSLGHSKSLSAFRSFDNLGHHEITTRTPLHTKSMLSMLFTKHKSAKAEMSYT